MPPEQLIALAAPYATWLLMVTAFSAVVCMILMVQWVQGRGAHPALAWFALAFPVIVGLGLVVIRSDVTTQVAHSIGIRLLQPVCFALPLAVLGWGGAFVGLRGPSRNLSWGAVQLGIALAAAAVIAVQGILHDPLFGLVRACLYGGFALVTAGGAFAGDVEKGEHRAVILLSPVLFVLLVALGEVAFLALADSTVVIRFPSVAAGDRAEVWRVYAETVVDPQWRFSLGAVGVAGLGVFAGAWRVISRPTEALVALAGGLLVVPVLLTPRLSLEDAVALVSVADQE